MSGGESNNKNASPDDLTLEIRRLTDQCSRAAFSCGEKDIDKWFQKKALKHHLSMNCRVVTGHLPGNAHPVGFYAATMRLENESDLPKEQKSLLNWDGWGSNRVFPAMHLRYVGVTKPMQRQGFGKVLMGAALEDFYQVATRTGIFALTLVAIDRKTANFYRKMGFIDFGDANVAQPKLLLPAASIIDLRSGID